jgi:transcriptional regulator with XRE-family HTH domain
LTSTAREASEALGGRLREIRRDAGLSGRALAALAGWHFTKVSKVELGKQNPSDADIRLWCRHCHAEDQAADLIATLRNIESQYIEWRRTLRAGTKRRQEIQRKWEHEAQLIRIYEPLLIPGILHTAVVVQVGGVSRTHPTGDMRRVAWTAAASARGLSVRS